MHKYSNDDLLMISRLQHYVFCRRQWFLIQQEDQWEDNYLTVSGNLMHERAHNDTKTERRGDLLITRALPVSSRILGLYGICDVVEWHRVTNGEGVRVDDTDELWAPVPVEYKRGKAKKGFEDIIQVTAQSLCLEEMLVCTISTCYIYYGETKRRVEVKLDDELRAYTRKICADIHDLQDSKRNVSAKYTSKCKSCSLFDICLPELVKKVDVDTYIQNALSEQ